MGRRRKFNEGEAFNLWKQGYSDSAIAQKVGVSRQRIQTWRDVLELPALDKDTIDTEDYYMIKRANGESVVIKDRK